MFKKIIDYLGKAIKSNTGVSTLSFSLVAVGVMSVIILIVVCLCMLIEVIATKTISSSLDGYASIIGAVAGLIVSVGLPKAINNYGENKYNNKQNNISTEDFDDN